MLEAKKQAELFDLGKADAASGKYLVRPAHPAWTEHKALLIRRYTKLFVMITRHGTYIDGFAGPQYPDKPEMWAAKLVLEGEPKFLRHFYFFETKKTKFAQLEAMIAAQGVLPKDRTVEPYKRDCNVGIRELLASGVIGEKEATFCLLDQHTTECEWQTVKALAEYDKKKGGRKIELFYFLPNSWLARALLNTKETERLERWWGRDDWSALLGMRPEERAACLVKRFEDELGYRFATAYPIYDRDDSSQVMYFMIHATDHGVAPELMNRAYRSVHGPEPTWDKAQASLFGGSWMLQTAKDGRQLATCGRCTEVSAPIGGSAEAAVAYLNDAGWTPKLNEWICPSCQTKPLGPSPRRPRRMKR